MPRAIALGILSVLCLVAPPSQAQTTYNSSLYNGVANIYGAIYPNTSPHYDAINFATSNGSHLDVDEDVSFNGSTLSAVFTSTIFTSTGGRVAAFMLGTDEFTTPVSGRTFIVQNFALSNVDFTTSNGTTGDVTLKIQGLAGGNTSLSLANSSLNCAITPLLYAPSDLDFNVSGSSQITGWQGNMGSATTLNVASGGTFRIKNSGLLNPASPSETLCFNTDTNHAIFNNSSLILDTSNLRWGSNLGTGSNMTFANNSTLQMIGQSKLRTHDITLQNSSLTMNNNTLIDVIYNTELDGSSASVATGALIQTTTLVAKGNATVALGVNGRLTTSTLDIRGGDTMTVVGNSTDIGEMTVSSQILFPVSGTGTLALADHAVLNLSNNATMNATSHAILTTTSLATLNLQEAQMTLHQGATFTNNGTLTVQQNSSVSIDGNVTIGGTIGGSETVDMQGTLTFTGASTLGNNTLITTNKVDLKSTSTLRMTLDATGLTSDKILIDNNSRQFTINNLAILNLNIINDKALAFGTKFMLIDYPNWQGAMGTHFNGLIDGATFTLGLNIYQINYNDAVYQPGESTFITLTTVSALPVELNSFIAAVERGSVVLNWKTATEVNNYGFEIERKLMNNWSKVGFVEGHGTSNAPQSYAFTDKPGSGKFEYRLKQIDRDGKFAYSHTVEADLAVPVAFGLEQNYPNPFNPSTTISFTVPSTGRATLKILNILGQEVATLFNGEAQAGIYNQVQFNATGFASGMYFSRLEQNGKVQMNKMTLLK